MDCVKNDSCPFFISNIEIVTLSDLLMCGSTIKVEPLGSWTTRKLDGQLKIGVATDISNGPLRYTVGIPSGKC